MKPALLVDTSVWIHFLNGASTPQVNTLTEYIENDYAIYVNPIIIQEVLQGVKNDRQFDSIKESLLALIVLNDDALEMAITSAKLYRRLRKRGVTIRKSSDCLIAQYAIKYNLNILHQDRDFDLIFENYR